MECVTLLTCLPYIRKSGKTPKKRKNSAITEILWYTGFRNPLYAVFTYLKGELMKAKLTTQEKLKDLRVDRNPTLE